MPHTPVVSVILSTYNGRRYLAEAIKSVLSQTFTDFELIVVNDASTDPETEAIIKGFTDPRIVSWANSKRLGLTKSLNRGLGTARGEFIARVDDDDAWLDAGKLGAQMEFLKNNSGYVLLGTQIVMHDGEKDMLIGKPDFPLEDTDIRKRMMTMNPLAHSSVMFRRSAAIVLGGYDERYEFVQDYEFWMRLLKTGRGKNLPERMVVWRTPVPSKETVSLKVRKQKIMLVIMRRYSNLYPGYFWNALLRSVRIIALELRIIS